MIRLSFCPLDRRHLQIQHDLGARLTRANELTALRVGKVCFNVESAVHKMSSMFTNSITFSCLYDTQMYMLM